MLILAALTLAGCAASDNRSDENTRFGGFYGGIVGGVVP
jgi:hypothetical protein